MPNPGSLFTRCQVRQVSHWQRKSGMGENLLYWLVMDGDKNSTQDFMPTDDLSKHFFEHVCIEISLQVQCTGDVVGGAAAAIQLIQEPQTFLRKRKGNRVFPGNQRDVGGFIPCFMLPGSFNGFSQ